MPRTTDLNKVSVTTRIKKIAVKLLISRCDMGADRGEILLKDMLRYSCSQIEDTFLRYPEFRNIFYYRAGEQGAACKILRFFFPGHSSLYINTPSIGPGLFIQHGFSTIISAKCIGKNCWINQQVTIGYTNALDCPTIGDDVTINAGAIIIGNVHIGNGAKVGAGSVVVKSVPANCTVAGNPAYIIRKNGIRVKEPL